MPCRATTPSPVEPACMTSTPSSCETSHFAHRQHSFSTATSARSSSTTPGSSRNVRRSPSSVGSRATPTSARSAFQRSACAARSRPVSVQATAVSGIPTFTSSFAVFVIVDLQVDWKSSPVGEELLAIGEVARRTGRAASSIRYYEEIGLIAPAVRVGGRRHYGPGILRTLAVVDTAQRAGLNLDEIRLLLDAAPGDSAPVEQLRDVAARKLPELEAMIERAELVRGWLECAAQCECPTLDDCPLFEEPESLPEPDHALVTRQAASRPRRPPARTPRRDRG